MSVLPAPVLIYRMKHMERMVPGSDAGIHAVFHISRFILQDIILALYNLSVGDKGSCISFHICLKGYLYMAVRVVVVVPGHVLQI